MRMWQLSHRGAANVRRNNRSQYTGVRYYESNIASSSPILLAFGLFQNYLVVFWTLLLYLVESFVFTLSENSY